MATLQPMLSLEMVLPQAGALTWYSATELWPRHILGQRATVKGQKAGDMTHLGSHSRAGQNRPEAMWSARLWCKIPSATCCIYDQGKTLSWAWAPSVLI